MASSTPREESRSSVCLSKKPVCSLTELGNLDSMEDVSTKNLYDFSLTLASRKAEEAAWRRYEASRWLQSLVGPISISNQPTEKEFIACLRNGLVLCNAINKIHPGSVLKVVENPSSSQSISREFQPLPAYQYFENVRNFLVAMEELKLPAFEASDIERDTLDSGSTAKVVDCILTLKSVYEWKKTNNGNGLSYKHAKSPLAVHSASRIHSRPPLSNSSDPCRRLEMSALSEKQTASKIENNNLEELVVKSLIDCLVDKKENIDGKLLASLRNRDMDGVRQLKKIMSSCLEEQLQEKLPEFQSVLRFLQKEQSRSPDHPPLTALDYSSNSDDPKCDRDYQDKSSHLQLFQKQEKELMYLKSLHSRAKQEFVDMQSQLQRDLQYLGSQVQELSSAAIGYHRVVQENRNLYNMVQDLKGNIRVYCRIRPISNTESKNTIDFIGEDGSMVISDPSNPQRDGKKLFQFNRVFAPNATQGDVFKDTQPLIRSVMDGYNVCIFAYGQTGSGKTYTMNGPVDGTSKDSGINYLALNHLFQISSHREEIMKYDIYVQMVEIYNEQVRDLLAEDSSTTKLEIRSCAKDNGLTLPDATIHCVKSTADVISLMTIGGANRVVSATAMNNRSSRSHSILTVHVHGEDSVGNNLRSCLHLIDLAGSERVDRSEVTGDRLKEAQYINKSLSCLGDVITALAHKNSHVPYRNSKLTLLLQDSLGGQAKTLMFAHVNPEEDSFNETISTLKFAQRVSSVELGTARMNKESAEIRQLKEQVENLKRALDKTIDPRSPKQLIDRTPPRLRRLSIENCKVEKAARNIEDHHQHGSLTPTLPTRSRRLSLEGSKCVKKVPAVMQDVLPAVKMTTPRSPTSVSYQKQMKTQITSFNLSAKLARNEAQNQLSTDSSHTPSLISSSNGKGSQIRRSLRTIGKLINGGSDRRNQHSANEPWSPMKQISTSNDGNSPIAATGTRTQRRQSLTGIPTTGPNGSRRSSLGGKPAELSLAGEKNAKTPPKKWM